MLRRIIALLVASAVLAERAAERSLPVRWFVLWALRRAETVVEDFVFDETGMPLAVEGFALAGNGPDDAFALAARFRALAAALATLLPLAWGFGRRPARREVAFGPVAPGCGLRPGGWTREPFDTS
jgi:hypothetical protein